MGTRSFGPDPALVARHAAAAVAGLQSSGVAACAKHFPGHGSTGDDSHLSLATVLGTMAEVRARDLPPFVAAIAAGSVAIMPGHLRVPELTGALPATLSPAAVTGLLRGELGFAGVVICDALEMKAASAVLRHPRGGGARRDRRGRPALPGAGHRRGDVPRGAGRHRRRGGVGAAGRGPA